MANVEANKMLVREFIDALGKLDTEKFLGYLTEDVMFETPGQFPAAGVKTKAQVAKEFPPMKEVLPNGLKFTILTMTAEDDRVHVELKGEAKTASGGDYNNRYHYAIVVRDGKICSFRDYLDSDLVMKVLVPTLERYGAVQADRDREAVEICSKDADMPKRSPVEIARLLLDALERADFETWASLLAENTVMKFPYSPAGLPKRCEGRAACEATHRGIFSVIESFAWHDLDLHATDDPELVFGTGRSEVLTKTSQPYRNQYCFIFRIRDGQVIEYCEYFDPLPAIAVFGPLLGASA